MKQFVYFIQRSNDGPIKIGKSKNPESRVNQLQLASVEPLRLLGVLSDEEKRIHDLFLDHRISGEWFRPHQDILNFIAKNTTIPEPLSPSGREHKNGLWRGAACNFRVSRSLYSKILQKQKEAEELTGVRIAVSAVIRAMLEQSAEEWSHR